MNYMKSPETPSPEISDTRIRQILTSALQRATGAETPEELAEQIIKKNQKLEEILRHQQDKNTPEKP